MTNKTETTPNGRYTKAEYFALNYAHISPDHWERCKESWLIAIAATPRVPSIALKVAAVFRAEVENRTHDHNGRRCTRGTVKIPVTDILERLGMDHTDSAWRQIRRAKTWLRRNGFIADYGRAAGGYGKPAIYVLTIPAKENATEPPQISPAPSAPAVSWIRTANN